MKFCRVHINKTTALRQLCSKCKMIFLWQSTHMGSRPHPAWFICSIWHYRPYYIAATTAWVGNQRCCTRLVQILFEPAETIRYYQWHKIIISKSVFRSASGISAWPNTLHHVYKTAGRNSTEISAKFPSLCWWYTAVHGLEAKQCGIITLNHQWHPKLCHWHQVLDDGEHFTTKHGQNRGFSADEQKPQKSHYHEQNQNWFNRYINCKERQKSWCYIWQCFKLRSFCELHLQICLVQFIQYQQKPKVSNNRCCQDPYPSLCDVQNRLLQQPVVRHPR